MRGSLGSLINAIMGSWGKNLVVGELNMILSELYEQRPFQIRNADEYDLANIIDVFVDPTDGLTSPFDYENSIIKGKMGSGKTMYLRANLAYYLYTIVPCLLEECPIILPIYIKMSDCQVFKNCDEIYNNIIIKILEEMVGVFDFYKKPENITRLHLGFKDAFATNYNAEMKINKVLEKIKLMSSEQYIETVSDAFSADANIGNELIRMSADYATSKIVEIKKNCIPKFSDVEDAYNVLFKSLDAKLLILFDEVGSINREFFKENGDNSFFETLMNQLRTLPFVRTKIAIYPHSLADVLPETRYGDCIELESNIDQDGFGEFLNRTVTLIEKYLNKGIEEKWNVEDLFDVSPENMDILEQIAYASNGNMRRLVHLLDSSMSIAYKRNRGGDKVNIDDVVNTLKEHAKKSENLFMQSEKEFLNDIVNVCRSRTACKFTFPNKSVNLVKYTDKSEEYNLVKLIEIGTGRKSNVYQFDYSYCILKDIPTHYVKNTDKVDKTRSEKTGEHIGKITKITDELIEQAGIPGKILGKLIYVNEEYTNGFAIIDDKSEFFITINDVILSDQTKKLVVGAKVRFIPVKYNESNFAKEVELL